MIDTNKLRGAIVSKGYSQSDVAKMLDITPKTFYLKMQKGVFGTDEAKAMIDFLDIDNPTEIFFADEVT